MFCWCEWGISYGLTTLNLPLYDEYLTHYNNKTVVNIKKIHFDTPTQASNEFPFVEYVVYLI